MKIIKYKFLSCEVNHGTEENPNIEQIILDKSMPWNEANEEIAKKEAYNGEYEIYDDGQPEPEPVTPAPTTDYATYEELAEAFSQGVDSI
jgi:hypothetical protein